MNSLMPDLDYRDWTREVERGAGALLRPLERPSPLPEFSMAFQPVVDLRTYRAHAYEAFVRSPRSHNAAAVLSQVSLDNIRPFDRACRARAIALAADLGLHKTSASLSINVNPRAVSDPVSHLDLTCEYAERVGFPLERLIFEFVEDAEMYSAESMQKLMEKYSPHGIRIAVDDFGAGYSGLELLVDFQPHMVKLDSRLVARADNDHAAVTVIHAIVDVCSQLNVQLVAEGVERQEQSDVLRTMGIYLQQGYYFARPGFERLPRINVPPAAAR